MLWQPVDLLCSSLPMATVDVQLWSCERRAEVYEVIRRVAKTGKRARGTRLLTVADEPTLRGKGTSARENGCRVDALIDCEGRITLKFFLLLPPPT